MKVKIAAQTFSYTLGAALCAYTAGRLLPLKANETANFIIKMDTLFDSFNSNNFRTSKELLKPVSHKSIHFKFWRDI